MDIITSHFLCYPCYHIITFCVKPLTLVHIAIIQETCIINAANRRVYELLLSPTSIRNPKTKITYINHHFRFGMNINYLEMEH